MLYILIADDEPDIREVLEMGLSRSFPLEVLLAESGKEALKIIQERGKPEVVISDWRMPNGDGQFLYNSIKSMGINVPFIVCSAEPVKALRVAFPDAFGIVEKPHILGPVITLVDSIVTKFETPPDFVPIRITHLLRMGLLEFDLYMCLSSKKYLKVCNREDSFLDEDANRFYSKKQTYLYITKEDAENYLKTFEQNMGLLMSSDEASSKDTINMAMDSLELVERVASVIGWKPQIIESAKKSVLLAIKSIAKEPHIFSLLKQRLQTPSSEYARHVSLQAMLTCLFCQHLGWTSDSTQLKLAMASLLHDIAVDEKIYNDIEEWNEHASDIYDRSAEVAKYRSHAVEAVSMMQEIQNLPPDVEQIVLQHHEKRDGTGFPRKLNASRIGPLPTLFIIAEDLVNYLGDGTDIEGKVDSFFASRDSVYNSGNFKKVFLGIKEKIILYRKRTT